MSSPTLQTNSRLLIVDDNQAIHGDFQKVLKPRQQVSQEVTALEAELFGDEVAAAAPESCFRLDSAFQGQEALEMVRKALDLNQPYALAFMDVRMPPGWDGIETTSRIWEVDPDLQIVICTAYSDYSWEEMLSKLGKSDRLVILKKLPTRSPIRATADSS